MTKLLACAAFAVGVVASPATFAAEKTITLAVKNMYCADCPFIVKKSLEGVPGVAKVTVSYKDKTATVTYDDDKADVQGLRRDNKRGLSFSAQELNAHDPRVCHHLSALRNGEI